MIVNKQIKNIAFFLVFITNAFSQSENKEALINYFDNAKNLDPIEGIWSLNVVNTLTYNNQIIMRDTDEVLSEWGIKRDDKLMFKVKDLGVGSRSEIGSFSAYFESSAIDGFYTYKVHFNNPDWEAESNVKLKKNFLIEYGYYVDEKFLKATFKNNFKEGMRLHWKFIWTKKYPKLSNSEYIEKNNKNWKGNGTAFFIDKAGFLATNYHVIADASRIEIEFFRQGKKRIYKVKVVKIDKQNDLAILKIINESFEPFSSLPYNFQTSLEDVGSSIFTLGYPMALSVMGSEIKFTDGKISSITGFKGNISSYQITAPVQKGNSGGPLFDFDGNIIGVNSSKISSNVADNVSYAIKSSYLKNLIDVLPKSLHLPNSNSIKNKTLTQKIKIISDYVVLLKVK